MFEPLARRIARASRCRSTLLRRPARRLRAGRDASRATPTAPRCSTTAAARPTRSAGCCCTSTASTTPRALRQSDAICTALQLINFWQDLSVDLPRGRLYLPRGRLPPPRRRRRSTLLRRHGQRRRRARWSPSSCDWARDADAERRAAGRTRCRAAPAGSCAWSCRAACASSRRSRAWTTRRCAQRPTGCDAGDRCRCWLWRALRMRAARGCTTAETRRDDARAVRAGQGRAQRLALLLRLPVPAAAAPRGDHRVLRLLPRGRRRRRRGQRPRRRGRPSSPGGARKSPRAFAGQPQPSGDAGADAARRRLRHRADAPAGGDRRLPDGPGADALPRLRRPARATATWWPASSARSRPTSSAAASDATVAYAHRLGLAMQLTNIIRDVGDDARRGRIYLPMDELQRSTSRRTRSCSAAPGATATASPR